MKYYPSIGNMLYRYMTPRCCLKDILVYEKFSTTIGNLIIFNIRGRFKVDGESLAIYFGCNGPE